MNPRSLLVRVAKNHIPFRSTLLPVLKEAGALDKAFIPIVTKLLVSLGVDQSLLTKGLRIEDLFTQAISEALQNTPQWAFEGQPEGALWSAGASNSKEVPLFAADGNQWTESTLSGSVEYPATISMEQEVFVSYERIVDEWAALLRPMHIVFRPDRGADVAFSEMALGQKRLFELLVLGLVEDLLSTTYASQANEYLHGEEADIFEWSTDVETHEIVWNWVPVRLEAQDARILPKGVLIDIKAIGKIEVESVSGTFDPGLSKFASLRNRLIRLAKENVSLRPHLLPLLK